MTLEDGDDPADAIGREHFPTCECFADRVQGAEMREFMYGLSQQHANDFVGHMIGQGICPSAVPYFVAMHSIMCLSMVMSAASHNDASLPEFTKLLREMYETTREQMASHMRRGDAIAMKMTEGSSRVQ